MDVEDDLMAKADAGRADPMGPGVVPERLRHGADTPPCTKPALPARDGDTSKPQDPGHGAPESGAIAASPSAKRKPRTASQPDCISREKLVRDAFDEAERASSAAFDAKFEATQRTDGGMHDLFGFAYVVAYKMSPWLRTLVKRLGEAKTNGKGEWKFARFRQVSTSHGIQANTAAADAACEVLRSRLGDYANFYVESGLD